MLLLRCFLFFCFFHRFLLVVVSSLERPGIRTLLTSKGINYVREIVVPLIVKELNHLKVPSASGKVDLFIGDLKYHFKNITLSQVKIPSSYISVKNNSGLFIKGDDLTFRVTEKWKYAFRAWFDSENSAEPYISDSGSCIIAGKRISLNIFVGIGKTDNNDLHVDASKCDLKIGKFDIQFHGGASWLYNFLVSIIKDFVKKDVQNLICKTATKILNDKLNAVLKNIPEEELIFNDTNVNVELVNPPSFNMHGIQLDLKGECYNVKHNVSSPYTTPTLPPITWPTPHMMYTWVTSFTFDTVLFALYYTGRMQKNITNADLNSYLPISLDTLAFLFIVPQLYEKYPGNDITIHLNITKPPRLSLREKEGYLLLVGTITFFVILDDKSLVDCFTLNAKGQVKIDRVYLERKNNQSYLCFTLSNTQTDISLRESNIGDINLDLLQFTVNVLSQFIVTRYLSVYARRGFPLTLLKDLVLYETGSILKKNHIMLWADFRLPKNWIEI